jgi:probable phosphoglycerate mutase
MRITTIRHGETDWNKAKRIQGSTDIELNETGLKQAKRLAKRLAAEPCDVIFSSDLQRARKTAEIINQHHKVEMIISPCLREASFGELEGQYYSDEKVRTTFAEYREKHVASYFETVHGYIDKILQKDYMNVFLVGHFGTIRAIICYLLRISHENKDVLVIGNTAIHTFEKTDSGEFHMTVENDTAHLDG